MNLYNNQLAQDLARILEDGTIRRLVDAFYARVQQDEILLPIFPGDFAGLADKQFLFLTQFFGGEPLYSQQYGQPAMKQRHLPFEITPTRASAWLKNMSDAMDEIELTGDLRDFMFDRLKQVAAIMVNTPEPA
ncbi:MAG TPA: globin [Bacilli bacterium]|nr:globin [Bacilli bacterium]